jgi:hypothetical protein
LDIGVIKKPNDARIPKLIANKVQAQTTTKLNSFTGLDINF